MEETNTRRENDMFSRFFRKNRRKSDELYKNKNNQSKTLCKTWNNEKIAPKD